MRLSAGLVASGEEESDRKAKEDPMPTWRFAVATKGVNATLRREESNRSHMKNSIGQTLAPPTLRYCQQCRPTKRRESASALFGAKNSFHVRVGDNLA